MRIGHYLAGLGVLCVVSTGVASEFAQERRKANFEAVLQENGYKTDSCWYKGDEMCVRKALHSSPDSPEFQGYVRENDSPAFMLTFYSSSKNAALEKLARQNGLAVVQAP